MSVGMVGFVTDVVAVVVVVVVGVAVAGSGTVATCVGVVGQGGGDVRGLKVERES